MRLITNSVMCNSHTRTHTHTHTHTRARTHTHTHTHIHTSITSILIYCTGEEWAEEWATGGECNGAGDNPLLRSSTARVRWSRLLLSTVSSICSFALLIREFILRCWGKENLFKISFGVLIFANQVFRLTFISTRSLNCITRACNLASSLSKSCLVACLDLLVLLPPSNTCCLRLENTSTAELNAGSMPPKS